MDLLAKSEAQPGSPESSAGCEGICRRSLRFSKRGSYYFAGTVQSGLLCLPAAGEPKLPGAEKASGALRPNPHGTESFHFRVSRNFPIADGRRVYRPTPGRD